MGVKNVTLINGVKANGVKMLKLVKDPCFGRCYEQNCQCENCWIKPSCLVCFRNKKK